MEDNYNMNKTALVVDDATFMRMMVVNILKEINVATEQAENGSVAIEKYVHVKPDFVMMDITMPEMDGIEAVKNIIKIDPDAKIIICSAMGQVMMVKEALTAGAKDFIVKPFQKERVIDAVNKLCLAP